MEQQQFDRTENATATATRPTATARRQPAVIAATVICSASMLVPGLWGFFAPMSFHGYIDFAPYNEHVIHDAGAFQIGMGTAVLLAAFLSDGLVAALTGFVVASGLHTVSHYTDAALGGHDSDVPALGVVTLIALFAMYGRVRGRR